MGDTPTLSTLRRAVPDLTIGASGPAFSNPYTPGAEASDRFAVEGWMRWPDALDAGLVVPLRDGVEALAAAGLHPAWIWAFDACWRIPAALRAPLSHYLGDDPRLLPHLWAWRVTREDAGWAPHRDWSAQAGFGPVSAGLSIWIPLVDVGVDEGCIGLVPAPHDRGPERIDPQAVRLLPAAAGEALVWRPDLTHWGGRRSAFAQHPRISLAIEVQSTAFAPFAEPLLPLDPPPAPEARRALIAARLADYGTRDRPGG